MEKLRKYVHELFHGLREVLTTESTRIPRRGSPNAPLRRLISEVAAGDNVLQLVRSCLLYNVA